MNRVAFYASIVSLLFAGALCLAGCDNARAKEGSPQVKPLVAATSPADTPSPAETAADPEPAAPATPADDAAAPDTQSAGEIVAPNGKPISRYCGNWVGLASAEEYDENKDIMWVNKLNLKLDSFSGEQVTGHSVCAGNLRPMTGTIKASAEAGKYDMVLREPGDDKYDGTFTCVLDTNNNQIIGEWQAFDPKIPVTKRTYDLEKRSFKYDPKLKIEPFDEWMVQGGKARRGKVEAYTDDACKYNASVKWLKSRNVDNMYKRDLEIMRNAIYARHGYTFHNRAIRDFFDQYVEWYVPVSDDVTAELTDVEKHNIELLKRYEKHATSYYDRFGR